MSIGKIAVIGGSGTVGKYVINELKESDYEIVVLVHSKEPERKDLTLVRGDILRIDDCRRVLKGAEAVNPSCRDPTPL